MPNVSFDLQITGIPEIMAKFANVTNTQMETILKITVADASDIVLQELQTNTPVDTGNLKDSESIDNQGLSAYIGPDPIQAYYGFWVEFGHHLVNGKFLPGQHYVERSFLNTRGKVNTLFQDRIAALVDSDL